VAERTAVGGRGAVFVQISAGPIQRRHRMAVPSIIIVDEDTGHKGRIMAGRSTVDAIVGLSY